MSQSQALYDTSAALALLGPWLRAHLPRLDNAVVRRFSQLVTGIFEQRSLLNEGPAHMTVDIFGKKYFPTSSPPGAPQPLHRTAARALFPGLLSCRCRNQVTHYCYLKQ
jgi:hypothetical protein